MPDGMTPENRPITPDFKIGGVTKLPANEASMQAAQNELKPEWKSNMPDIRMQREEEDKNPQKERLDHELRLQEMFGETGRDGYLGEFSRAIKDLKKQKDALKTTQTNVDVYDKETKKLSFWMYKMDVTTSQFTFMESQNVDEARERLKKIAEDAANLALQAKVEQREKRLIDDEVKKANEIVKIPETINKEIEKTREKIAESYVNIVHEGLDEINELNKFLDQKKNAYPYDSRWSIEYFKRALKTIDEKLRNKDRYEEEGLALTKMLKKDMLWAFSSARMMEAMGPAYETYFDGELELQRMRTTHTELLSEDFVRVFKRDLPGLELSDSEKGLIQKTLQKIKNDEDPEKYALLNKESLRDVAITYQDEFGYWLYATVAAGQGNMELSSLTDKEAGDHYMKLDEVKRRFLIEVFDAGNEKSAVSNLIYIDERGNKHSVVEKIYNPFCMPKNDFDASKQYVLRMHELVVNSKTYKDSLEKISDSFRNGGITEDEMIRNVSDLAKKVLAFASGRLSEWETLEDKNIYDRLGFTIIKELTNLERGTLACGDLGWRWEYEQVSPKIGTDPKDGDFVVIDEKNIYKKKIDENTWNLYSHILFDGGKRGGNEVFFKDDSGHEKAIRIDSLAPSLRSFVEGNLVHGKTDRVQVDKDGKQFFVKRISELGSIYDNHDVTTVMFWARHIVDYDKYADTRSSLLFPTIGWYRDRWESEPPYFRPELSEFAAKDTVLLGRLDRMLSDNNPMAEIKGRHVYTQGKKGLQDQKFGEFNPKVAKFIKENVWAFVTPWLSDPGKGQDEYYLSVPVFLPTYIPDVNFWRCFTLERPSAKLKSPDESIWHKRLGGEKLSEMKWENMDTYKYSWGLVNHDQMERWFGPWITPHKFNRATEGEVEKHLAMPSGTSDKESGKRYRLGLRSGVLDGGVVRASSSAQNKILASAQFSETLGIKIDAVKNEIDVDTVNLNDKLNKWRNDWVAPWINSLLDMPYEVRKVKNYPGTASQCAIFTYLQVRRILASGVITAYRQLGSVENALYNIEKSF